jgi:hypothetical protein
LDLRVGHLGTTPRGNWWSDHGPDAAGVLVEELESFERIGLVDSSDDDDVPILQRVAYVGREFSDLPQERVTAGCDGACGLGPEPAVLAQEGERVVGYGAVAKSGDDGLVEEAAPLVMSLDLQPACVDVVDPLPEVPMSFGDQLLVVPKRVELARQVQGAAVHLDVDGIPI